MRIINFLIILSVLLCFDVSNAFADNNADISLESETIDKDILQQVEKHLNSVSSIKAEFMQISPDGAVAKGDFYLQRPSRMRWEYAPPVPVLMVSNGRTLTYYDSELEQVSNISLDDSLAGFLSRKTINFDDDSLEVLAANLSDGVITVHIRQKERPEAGELTLEFVDSLMRLKRLITKDADGLETFVSFANMQEGLKLSKKLFVLPRKSVFEKK